jgi:hypothetical protein
MLLWLGTVLAKYWLCICDAFNKIDLIIKKAATFYVAAFLNSLNSGLNIQGFAPAWNSAQAPTVVLDAGIASY